MPAIRDLNGTPIDVDDLPPGTRRVERREDQPAPPNTETMLLELEREVSAVEGQLAAIRATCKNLRLAVNADLDKRSVIEKLAEAVAKLTTK